MTEQVLTDAELANAMRCGSWMDAQGVGRAVEAAVLEKCLFRDRGVVDAVWNEIGIKSASDFSRWIADLRRVATEGGELNIVYNDGATHGRSFVLSPGDKYVPEREVRTRERAAWDAGLSFVGKLCGGFNLGPRYDYPEKERDLRYPLSMTTRPRTVTLDSGVKIVAASSGRFIIMLIGGGEDWGNTAASIGQYAASPADFRKLADLTERPTEDVPDGA